MNYHVFFNSFNCIFLFLLYHDGQVSTISIGTKVFKIIRILKNSLLTETITESKGK